MSLKLHQQPLFLLLLLGVLLLGITGCQDPEGGEDLSFDQSALLTNLAANIIVPNYEDLNTRLSGLESSASDFGANPTQGSLDQVRTDFVATYRAWMYCSTFEFGPAADRSLRAQVNTFPTDASQIEANLLSNNYDLTQASNLDGKGLPALDYLLYGVGGSPAAVLDEYNDSNKGPGLVSYLQAVIADLIAQLEDIPATWSGSYQATFNESLGTDVGSSMGQFVNQFNFDYELLKKPRLGIPLGVQTLGTPLPEKSEALFSGISTDLILAHFDALSNLYFGRSTAGVDGYGLHEALQALEANYNGQLLADAIAAQIETTRAALEAIPGPLSATVVDNPTPANAAYSEVQRLLVLFKTDMTSSLGILITYVDNDGD